MGGQVFPLKDGRTVVVHSAAPPDVPAIARLYAELSPESFHTRFHAGQPAPALVARLAHFGPPPRTVSVIAGMTGDPEHLAAEARYVWLGEGVAELGVTVLDAYQGAGLGRILLRALVERAGGSGLVRLRAVVSLSNTPMLRLLVPYGWVLAQPTDGSSVACLEISTIGGMPGWPPATGRRVLVESSGWFDDDRVAALRAAGNDVRQCTGPQRRLGRTCPLVTSGRCRLAEEADLIVSMLPGDDEDCAAVKWAHRRLWPGRLAV